MHRNKSHSSHNDKMKKKVKKEDKQKRSGQKFSALAKFSYS